VSRDLDYLPAAESFLDPDRADANDPASARAVVIPFGLEMSVSYGSGTAAGPAALLAASHQLELYDEELGCEPCLDYGIATVRQPTIAIQTHAGDSQLRATAWAHCEFDRHDLFDSCGRQVTIDGGCRETGHQG
jgi:arginase family enzyme